MQTVLLTCISFPELGLYATQELEVTHSLPQSIPEPETPDAVVTTTGLEKGASTQISEDSIP